jgi:D-lactate dehydrogenase
MPACINRILGNPPGTEAHPSLPEALVAISRRAGLPLWIPDDVTGFCCGTPWSSKGFAQGQEAMAGHVTAALRRWSDDGRLPVVLDATSCTHGLLGEVAPEGVHIVDSIAWVHDHLLDRIEVRRKHRRAVIHSTCSATHLGLGPKLAAIAERFADEVVVPAAGGCCGMAGDRGWLHPELPASALRDVAAELAGETLDVCVSSNRTCEAALTQVTGRPYESFVLALEEASRE